MEENKITLQEALQSHEDLLAFVAQEAQSDDYLEAKRSVAGGPHPTHEMLHDHVWGVLDKESSRIIRDHMAFCKMCAKKVFQMRRIKQESAEKLVDWANEFPPVEAPALPIEDLMATDFWTPHYAGQLVSAGDIPEQQHTFHTSEGNIELSCLWRAAYRKKPAYFIIRWRARLTTRKEIHARFINPETQTMRTEVRLGIAPEGEASFSSQDLGFDPSCEAWSIMLVLRDI